MKTPTLQLAFFFIVILLSSVAFADSTAIDKDLLKSNSLSTVDSLPLKNSELDTTSEADKNEKDPWYIEYLLIPASTLFIAIFSFLFAQYYFRRLDKKRAREKYIGILRVIADEIKRNLDLECHLHAYFYVDVNPTFGLSFFVSDRDFSELMSVCLNYNLLKQIFHKYYELKHIQNRIDRIIVISNELSQIESIRPVDHNRQHDAERRLRSERGGAILLLNGNVKTSSSLYNMLEEEINLMVKAEKIEKLPDDYLKIKYFEFQDSPEINKFAKLFSKDLSKRNKFFEEPPTDDPKATTV